MSTGAVAERYAQALFELGQEEGTLATLTEKLREFSEAYESNRELRLILTNPVLDREQRRGVLTGVAERLGLPSAGVKGLLVMMQRGRLAALAATVQRLTELSDRKEGVLRALVTTASAMPEAYYQNLTAQLSAATNKKIILERSVDEDLVGGAIARVGDTLIDGSIRGKLQKMERDLLSAVLAGAS